MSCNTVEKTYTHRRVLSSRSPTVLALLSTHKQISTTHKKKTHIRGAPKAKRSQPVSVARSLSESCTHPRRISRWVSHSAARKPSPPPPTPSPTPQGRGRAPGTRQQPVPARRRTTAVRPSCSRGEASAPLSPPRGPPGAHPDAQRPGSNRPRRRGRRRSSGSLPVSTPVRAAKAHSIVDTSSSRAGLWRDRAERELSVVASGAVSEAGERARVAVSGFGAVRANQFHAPLAPKRIRVPTARIYEAAAVGDALRTMETLSGDAALRSVSIVGAESAKLRGG